ncbi:MAG: protein TolQ [Metallibacterium scheffleri]|jgi:biopolymer transport protein TolQ|uniref:protein TolQ n=1 Tax=Metallibacterium scheffleri TaxID=993689 RepID=UPI0026F254EE|nr:protein TolQ [Metallibacterium scheffleri]MCK9366902.1 protein TolQ [Metallibacterium scheffleri]
MNGDLNILDLVLHASLPVKAVLLILIIFSFMSWVIIFRKKAMLDATQREANAFEERFWSGSDLASLYREASARGEGVHGMEGIFEAGFREFARQRQRRMDTRNLLEAAQRAMRVALMREVDRMEHNLEFLANVGSISPYVGLFGTVWGIMAAFQGLGSIKEATIAMVAPGISEALVATAMGLFAAIPAVWAYNRYATRVERMTVRFDTFQDEFFSILQRQGPAADDHA